MPLPNATRHLLITSVFTVAVTLGACAGTPTRASLTGPMPLDSGVLTPPTDADDAAAEAPRRATISFDNQSQDYVHVYLVQEQQRWHLGRVERGTRATLRIPEQAFVGARRVRIAVEPGARSTSEPRVAPMLAEPMKVVLGQRWTFTQSEAGGLLTWLPIGHAAASPR